MASLFNETTSELNNPIRINPTAKTKDDLGTFKRKTAKNKTTVEMIGRGHGEDKPRGATLFELAAKLSETGAAVSAQVARTWVTYDVCQLKGYGAFSVPARGRNPATKKLEETLRVFVVMPGETWQDRKGAYEATLAAPKPAPAPAQGTPDAS